MKRYNFGGNKQLFRKFNFLMWGIFYFLNEKYYFEGKPSWMEKSKSTRFPKQSRSSKRKSPTLTPADDKSDENGLESRKMADLGSNKISSNYKTSNEDLSGLFTYLHNLSLSNVLFRKG